MKIEPFSLPLSRPLETAAGTIDAREGFLVRVELDGDGLDPDLDVKVDGFADGETSGSVDGGGETGDRVVGVGEATPLPGWTESLEECEAALRGLDDPVAAVDGGARTLSDAPAARHGVSLAVHDAHARATGEPLYRYLGADRAVESVPVNATVGDGTPEETAAAVGAAVEDGYTAVKVKVGARSLSADRERLAAARRHCPAVELRADANGAWDRPKAACALKAFADLDVAFVEQPLPAADLAGHATLREDVGAEVGVGVALDEGLVEHGLEALLEAEAADLVVCKPMALGGVDRARSAAWRARKAAVEPVVTTTVDGAVARAGAVHLAASLSLERACGLATGDRLATDLREDVAPIVGGAAVVPHGKGNIPPS